METPPFNPPPDFESAFPESVVKRRVSSNSLPLIATSYFYSRHSLRERIFEDRPFDELLSITPHNESETIIAYQVAKLDNRPIRGAVLLVGNPRGASTFASIKFEDKTAILQELRWVRGDDQAANLQNLARILTKIDVISKLLFQQPLQSHRLVELSDQQVWEQLVTEGKVDRMESNQGYKFK